MSLEDELESETTKWLEKLKTVEMDGDRAFVENIKAYISDAGHFLKNRDMIRAFEAVIWAWAWYEIGKDIGKIKGK